MTEYDQPAWCEIPLGIAIMLKWPAVCLAMVAAVWWVL